MQTEEDFGFRVCRVCLKAAPDVALSSLLDRIGGQALEFLDIAGVSVWGDKGINDALICGNCSRVLKEAYNLRTSARYAERSYFKWTRKEGKRQGKRAPPAIETSGNDGETQASSGHGIDQRISAAPDVREVEEVSAIGMPSTNGPEARSAQEVASAEEVLDSSSKVQVNVVETSEPASSFKCPTCTKTFRYQSALHRHIAFIHENIRNFACDVCSKSFASKSHIKDHLLTHIPVAERKIPCPNCGKFQSSKVNLKKHIKVVHEKVERFRCDLCPYVCYLKEHFKRHRASHDRNPARKFKSSDASLSSTKNA